MNIDKKTIMYLNLDDLVPHPQNPRKDLGDLTELADSIKTMGIMQNLTVIPEDEDWNRFKIIIGHRRAAAAKLAGLTEVPCVVIEHMDEKEQLATMLLENIQRNDLTIVEQAEGFQMMLDIGSSVTEIANKTGFGETTIRHRVKLLELDRGLLEEKQSQMKINDMILLEKIKNPENRDYALRVYGGDLNFAQRVKEIAAKEENDEKAEQIKALCREAGLKPADKAWELTPVKEIELKSFDGTIDIPKEATQYSNYITHRNTIDLYKEKEEKEDAEEEREERNRKIKETERRCRSLQELFRQMNERMTDYAMTTKFDEEQKNEIEKCVQAYLLTGAYISAGDIYSLLCRIEVIDEESDEDKMEAIKKIGTTKVWLAILCASLERRNNILDNSWRGEMSYQQDKFHKTISDLIIKLGYKLSVEETRLLNGEHPLYDR
jgi:ParB family transcriptional regulator, chromosome partitioning protein